MFSISSMVRTRHKPETPSADTSANFTAREERLELVAHELAHRIKNLMAVVQAIATQTGRRSANLKDFQTEFSRRIGGLSRSIDLLVNDDRHSASMADLVRNQLEPFGEVDGVRIAVIGPVVKLDAEAAQNIGLAMHELATNATKYGALSVPQGAVTVTWELVERAGGGGHLGLTWRERDGPEVNPPLHQGFGHVVLERLTGQSLQGKVDYEFASSGVSWHLEIPAAVVQAMHSRKRPCSISRSMRNG